MPLGGKAEKLPKLGAAAGIGPADKTDESSLLANVITQPLQYVYHLGLLEHEKVKIPTRTIGTKQIQADLNLRCLDLLLPQKQHQKKPNCHHWDFLTAKQVEAH